MMNNNKLHIRPYKESDKAALLDIFKANIREEWGERYHQGQYKTNAESYIDSVIDDPTSDLHTVSKTYLEPGGAFLVLEDVSGDQPVVAGMVGLQLLEDKEGEIRRNCLLPKYRGKGWGTRMCEQLQDMANRLGLVRVICSTPEHGEDVLRFYRRLGFAEYGEREEMHGTPIKEVFLEWHVQNKRSA